MGGEMARLQEDWSIGVKETWRKRTHGVITFIVLYAGLLSISNLAPGFDDSGAFRGFLSVTREVSSTIFRPGTTIDVSLQLTRPATDNIIRVRINELVPEGWQALPDSITGGGALNQAEGRIEWDFYCSGSMTVTYSLQAPQYPIFASALHGEAHNDFDGAHSVSPSDTALFGIQPPTAWSSFGGGMVVESVDGARHLAAIVGQPTVGEAYTAETGVDVGFLPYEVAFFRSLTLLLSPGWHLMSLSLDPFDTAVPDLSSAREGNSSQSLAIDRGNDNYVWQWDPVIQSYALASELKALTGYWFLLSEVTQLTFLGVFPRKWQVDPVPDWSLIGTAVQIEAGSLNRENTQIWWWSGRSYRRAEVLSPGTGYAVFKQEAAR